MKKEFSAEDIRALEPAEKVGLLATISPEGQPHITLITSLQALDGDHLAFGEFSWGLSKWYVRNNPKTAFVMMTLDRSLWRGKALWTHYLREGREYEMYNKKPMFRYNTYFGINTVHYLDVVEFGGREKLPLGAIIGSTLATQAARGGAAVKRTERILPPLAESFFNVMGSMKFIAYVDADGFPVLVPALQCQAADSGRLVFSAGAYGKDLLKIPAGSEVAVFGCTMQMENILVRGTFAGFRRYRGVKMGTVDIDWAYNSMPPVHGQIYPELPLEPVVRFQG